MSEYSLWSDAYFQTMTAALGATCAVASSVVSVHLTSSSKTSCKYCNTGLLCLKSVNLLESLSLQSASGAHHFSPVRSLTERFTIVDGLDLSAFALSTLTRGHLNASTDQALQAITLFAYGVAAFMFVPAISQTIYLPRSTAMVEPDL